MKLFRCKKHTEKQVQELNEIALDWVYNCKPKQALEIYLHNNKYHIEYYYKWDITRLIGKCHLALNNYKKAKIIIMKACRHYQSSNKKDYPKYTYELFLDMQIDLSKALLQLHEYNDARNILLNAEDIIDIYNTQNRYIEMLFYYQHKGRVLFFTNEYKDSLNNYQKAKKILSNLPAEQCVDIANCQINFELGRAYNAVDNFTKANEILERISIDQIRDKSKEELLNNKMSALVNCSKFQSAIELYEENRDKIVQKHYPTNTMYFLAAAYKGIGELKKSLDLFKKVRDNVQRTRWEYRAAKIEIAKIKSAH